MEKRKKFFVTTPIYYPNAKPHIGTLYSTLLADIFARWHKSIGKETFFLTGLDEHGQKIQEAAEKNNVGYQDFVDSMVPPFTQTWQDFGLEYNDFVRTSSEIHKKTVIKIFEKLIAKNMIYKGIYEEFYCVHCETFVAEDQDAKGTAICLSCQRPAKKILEENYFFKLSEFQKKLLHFYDSHPNFIEPSNRMNEVISFVKAGLKDLSITRKNVKWGIPFPADPTQTIYVWGDALTNYISAIGYESNPEMFAKFWPADAHIIGKDIVRFHAVYWPAILMAAGLELPKKLVVHGYILVNNQKMSKSLGNAIDPEELLAKFGQDAVRYYLAKQMAITQDGSFDFEELKNCHNADLANNLGNLVNRITTLASKNNCTSISPIEPKDADCKELFAKTSQTIKSFIKHMDNFLVHMAIIEVVELCSAINTLIHKKEPWKLAKINPSLFQEVIQTSAQALNLASSLLYPVIPSKIKLLKKCLIKDSEFSLSAENINTDVWQQNLELSIPQEVLFGKLEYVDQITPEPETQKDSVQEKNVLTKNISFEELAKVQLSIGKILVAEKVLKSDKLLRLEVDFGSLGKKQVVSGIAEHYKPENLIGSKAVFVTNLAPRKIMGLESQAMILAAKDGANFSICQPEKDLILEGTILS